MSFYLSILCLPLTFNRSTAMMENYLIIILGQLDCFKKEFKEIGLQIKMLENTETRVR